MKDFKSLNFREIYIYLLLSSAFISISVFEILVVVGLLITIYDLFKRNLKLGYLGKPVLLFSSVSTLSTAVFNPKLINKGIEEGVFQLLYFFNLKNLKIHQVSLRINYILIIFAVVLLPVVLYKGQKYGNPSPIWGGPFEVGQFYSIFSLTSLLLSLYFFKNEKKFLGILFGLLSVAFLFVVFYSHRRTAILGLVVVFYLLLIVLLKNKLLNKKIIFIISLVFIFTSVGGYLYLSKTDNRFQVLNEIIEGKRDIRNETNLQIVSSSRYGIMKDAISIIETDIKNKNFVNLLFGHGIYSGIYLPHKYSPEHFGKYESVFIISEIIEVGVVGLLAELWLIFVAFKRFLSIKITRDRDIYATSLFIPLLLHLVGISFTFFWDALLPLYLLLYKIGEEHFCKF